MKKKDLQKDLQEAWSRKAAEKIGKKVERYSGTGIYLAFDQFTGKVLAKGVKYRKVLKKALRHSFAVVVIRAAFPASPPVLH